METPEKADQDTSEEVSSVKDTTEEKALEVIEDEEDLDEGLLIEDDGDFFWVLQRVIWSLVKGIVLLGMIIFSIWFIWGTDQPFSGKSTKKTPISETEENERIDKMKKEVDKKRVKPEDREGIESSIGAGEVSKYSLRITQKAYDLDQQRIVQSSDVLPQSINWLKRAKALGDISMDVLRMENSVIRAQKIESTIVSADKALEESVQLQSVLSSQIGNLLLKKNALDAKVLATENEIFARISHFNSNGIEEFLSQKIMYQKDLVVVSEAGKIRETLLKNIRNFDLLLRTKRIPLVKPTEMIQW